MASYAYNIRASVARVRRAAARFRPNAFALFLAFSFALQGYVVQTHIHVAGEGTPTIGSLLKTTGDGVAARASVSTERERAPGNAQDDPTHCPFCQEYLHSGAYVTPAAALLVLPQQPVSIVPLVLAERAIFETVSHSWRGRAPPAA